MFNLWRKHLEFIFCLSSWYAKCFFCAHSFHIYPYYTFLWLLTVVWCLGVSMVGSRKSILGRNCLRLTPPWTSHTTCTAVWVWPFSVPFTVCTHWAATWSPKTHTTATALALLVLVVVTMTMMSWWWLVVAVVATWAWCCSHRYRQCLLAWDAWDLYRSMQPCVMYSLSKVSIILH